MTSVKRQLDFGGGGGGSSKSAMPVSAPKTLRYEQDAGLPVAIEARSNRRTFFPSNGDTFGPSGTNVIKITLNSQSFVDFSHSYLQFKFNNHSAAQVALDQGCPFFTRLQIMSGGEDLEDIQEYSRLYSILQAAQGSDLTANEYSITQHSGYTPVKSAVGQADFAAAAAGGATAAHLATANAGANALNPNLHAELLATSATGQASASRTFNVPLVSGIFNVEKYFPLLLTDQGLDIYLTCAPTVDIGVWSADPTANPYTITNVKYIAHEVNLDDSFINQMKASMGATGGVLSMASTTYKYYQNVKPAGAGQTHTANISCRVKSLKGLIVRPQHQELTNNRTVFSMSTGSTMGITEAQFRVGSVLYPQSAIQYTGIFADY